MVSEILNWPRTPRDLLHRLEVIFCLRSPQINRALVRLGITPPSYRREDWLADAPDWRWPDFNEYRKTIWDWRVDE